MSRRDIVWDTTIRTISPREPTIDWRLGSHLDDDALGECDDRAEDDDEGDASGDKLAGLCPECSIGLRWQEEIRGEIFGGGMRSSVANVSHGEGPCLVREHRDWMRR